MQIDERRTPAGDRRITDIESRKPKGYDSAAGLFDLRAIAEEQGTIEDFDRRLRAIRERHANKGRFIERLTGLG